ncbi:hypothetical protein [Actinomycetospora sp. TBRC 11914]|uniref:hypothetical protein n=1 Tax=Actinomycetospora sp. TBRC 11914 TaxID=2729387 RepID=UPI00145EFDFF|nr:hypothetical protein [Actinomycetospora sp. TBRC 11914]NMO93531.1 hypothetical protein [Actinomycetospora sp. TBRC 11914]
MSGTSIVDVPAPRTEGPVLQAHEKARCRAAAAQARRVLPEPVGELIARELDAYADFAHRFDASGLVPRVVLAVLGRPSPPPTPSALPGSAPPPAAPAQAIRKRVATRPEKVTRVPHTGPFFRDR